MRVTFVLGAHETIGVEYVSAYVRRAGVEVSSVYDAELFNDLLFVNGPLGRLFNRRPRIVEEVHETRPDLVAFSIVTPNLPWSLEIAAGIKAGRDVPIVFGGIHPSVARDRLLRNPQVDYAIVGEGEQAMLDLVQAVGAGDAERLRAIPNLCMRANGSVRANPPRPLVQDLDTLPFPDKDLFYRHVAGYAHCYKTAAARGCMHRCTFCYHSWWRELYRNAGTYVRRRSVDAVIEELKEARRRYGCEIVRFNDEDLLHHKEWFLAFAERYASEVALPFWCYTHPASVDEERVAALRRAGCYRTEMGVQAIRPGTKRTLGREETLDQTRRAIGLLRRSGITLAADNLFYVPGQTEEEIVELARFYNENRVDITQNLALHYFPGIPIIRTALEKGILSEGDEERIFDAPAETMVLYSHFQKSRTFERLRTYLSLLLLLPRRVNEVILRRRLWRFIPILHPILVFGLLSALRAPKEDHWYERRHRDRYRTYMGVRLRELLGRRPLSPPPSA